MCETKNLSDWLKAGFLEVRSIVSGNRMIVDLAKNRYVVTIGKTGAQMCFETEDDALHALMFGR